MTRKSESQKIKNGGLFKRIRNPYEKSMRRRINMDYVVSYIVIGVVMLCVFMVAYGYYYCKALSKTTPVIAAEIKDAYIDNNGAINGDFRSRLSSIANVGDVNVINIYGGDGNLIMTTAADDKNIATVFKNYGLAGNIASVFSGVFDGIYMDNFILSDINLRIVIGYSLSGVKEDYKFTIIVFALTILFGAVVFTFTGYARIQNLFRPLDDMTSVAKKISGENLGLRLDADSAQYELKELAATVNDMIDRLEDSYDRQKHFVSDVSHELRTPISVISGYASMLKRWGTKDEEVLNESIEAIINEADNMQNLVEALLFLTRHDNKTIKYDFSNFNLSELAEDVVKDTQIVHTDFEIDSEIEADVFIYADDSRIKQLIRIFLENAIKYSGESRKVIVGIQKRNEGAIIKVTDFGIGIEQKDIKKIFDRFYRADESRTKLISGYGLGLSMAKEIVLGHKGKINVKSKKGQGSEFSAYIPFAKVKKN